MIETITKVIEEQSIINQSRCHEAAEKIRKHVYTYQEMGMLAISLIAAEIQEGLDIIEEEMGKYEQEKDTD